ncbi:MAG: type II toxin-antitoxin system PemK/MazF family toxin, partial [Desulfobacteraceae bacterium]
MGTYTPRQGDLIAITFDPQSGYEQKGRRPAFVVSKDLFNRKTGMAIVCPVTNTDRSFPFHIPM